MMYTEVCDGHIMTVDEFRESVRCGLLIDYDGYGYPAITDEFDGVFLESWAVRIPPSRLDLIPADATHISWYNR